MPSLICSSRYTIDSQILRKTAQSLGWETLRLDGKTIPDWFDPPDADIALFYTAPHAFDIARQLGRKLLGCDPDWTVNLPSELLNRDLEQTKLRYALRISEPRFVKHAVSKAFPAGVYDAEKLSTETTTIHPDSLVHIGEPVEFECEFRCFVSHQRVNAISTYVYDGQIVADYDSFPDVPATELDDVKLFAESVLKHPGVSSPDAFVLDVGIIRDRGWAVVECNECWASGIYACDPTRVLETLLCGNVQSDTMESPDWESTCNSLLGSASSSSPYRA